MASQNISRAFRTSLDLLDTDFKTNTKASSSNIGLFRTRCFRMLIEGRHGKLGMTHAKPETVTSGTKVRHSEVVASQWMCETACFWCSGCGRRHLSTSSFPGIIVNRIFHHTCFSLFVCSFLFVGTTCYSRRHRTVTGQNEIRVENDPNETRKNSN